MAYKNLDRRRSKDRERRSKRRAEFLDGKVCANCGSLERLELDHIDPSTKISSQIWSWSPKRFTEEVAKCQILCKPCHKQKTVANQEHHRGEQCRQSKLRTWQVEEILRSSETNVALAERFGVSDGQISGIRHGLFWKHIPRPPKVI